VQANSDDDSALTTSCWRSSVNALDKQEKRPKSRAEEERLRRRHRPRPRRPRHRLAFIWAAVPLEHTPGSAVSSAPSRRSAPDPVTVTSLPALAPPATAQPASSPVPALLACLRSPNPTASPSALLSTASPCAPSLPASCHRHGLWHQPPATARAGCAYNPPAAARPARRRALASLCPRARCAGRR
jgi:hypothetical protein